MLRPSRDRAVVSEGLTQDDRVVQPVQGQEEQTGGVQLQLHPVPRIHLSAVSGGADLRAAIVLQARVLYEWRVPRCSGG